MARGQSQNRKAVKITPEYEQEQAKKDLARHELWMEIYKEWRRRCSDESCGIRNGRPSSTPSIAEQFKVSDSLVKKAISYGLKTEK